MIGLIISLLLVLGGFSAAKDDMNKRYAKKQSKKLAVASKYEFEGFEQALFSTQREIKLLWVDDNTINRGIKVLGACSHYLIVT